MLSAGFCDKNQNLWLPVTTAIASPISDNDCPPLYVYDPNGNYISLRYSGSNPQEAFKIIVYHYPDESGMTNFTEYAFLICIFKLIQPVPQIFR